MFANKGWDAPPRQRREAELEALSTDGLSFLPLRRKYKTLVRKDICSSAVKYNNKINHCYFPKK